MSRGINKVVLIGHLGQDPESRAMPSGKMVANVRIATTESWRDRTTGEQKEQTEWHSVVFFDRLAEVVAEYLRKGQQVYIEGKLRTRKWDDKQGVTRYATEVVGLEMQMLGPKPTPRATTTEKRVAGSDVMAAPDHPARVGERTYEDVPF